MLTKCMALELAEHGIRVNCVRPAQVKTDHVGRVGQAVTRISEDIKAVNDRKLINRLIEMKEVADAVMFLSSTASTAVNGSDILLDGGLFTR
jgi:3-oxoacyl-[acyl-carrier protein] reductase